MAQGLWTLVGFYCVMHYRSELIYWWLKTWLKVQTVLRTTTFAEATATCQKNTKPKLMTVSSDGFHCYVFP